MPISISLGAFVAKSDLLLAVAQSSRPAGTFPFGDCVPSHLRQERFFRQACCESRTESMQEERIAYVHSIFLAAGSSQDFGF